jgi:2-polyprenyl-3-methyl-5-hydroxy-6-metoxy-1,4-benzoquinol methylase
MKTATSTCQLEKTSTDATPVEDADLHASSHEYARRFQGAVGAWMLEVQESVLTSLVDSSLTSVLDIGGGHGQIAVPLMNLQHSVTILGSSPACAQQVQHLVDAGAISFKSGNLVEVPFHNRSFDAVVSFRLMSHCTAWRTLIAEMCRVAERTVVFDYPVWCSANILTPILFVVKRAIEGNTRTYRIFTTRELTREFQKHGFRCTAIRKQFFFPMGIHRAFKSRRISSVLEGTARCLGLTRLFGSPVIIKFERIAGND